MTRELVFPETPAELREIILWICMLLEVRKYPLLPQEKLSLANIYLEKVRVCTWMMCFGSSLKLQRTAGELILTGAQRLRLYRELFYPEFVKGLLPLDLTSRAEALRLFNAGPPKTIRNHAGFQEETIAHILRHTQLLPRHFLILLNSIFKSKDVSQSLHPFPISEMRILNGVRQVDERIVPGIFVAFTLMHPTAEDVCKRCIPELGQKFPVGELYRVHTRRSKAVFDGENLFELQCMLMEIGAIGRVKPGQGTDIYIQDNFEHTARHEIAVSHDDELCIHPLSPAIFGNDRQDRPVYPYGSDLNNEDYQENSE